MKYTNAALNDWRTTTAGRDETSPTPAQQRVATDTQILICQLLDPDAIPTTRDAVWAHANEVTNRLGDTMDTVGREELWQAIVNHRNPAWALGLTERYRLLATQPDA